MPVDEKQKQQYQAALQVGAGVKLRGMYRRRWWWVQARSTRFAVLTVAVPFKPSGTLAYTIIDWHRGVRGPVNLLGGGWGNGSYSPAQCAALLEALESGDVEVSHRNYVELDLAEVFGRG